MTDGDGCFWGFPLDGLRERYPRKKRHHPSPSPDEGQASRLGHPIGLGIRRGAKPEAALGRAVLRAVRLEAAFSEPKAEGPVRERLFAIPVRPGVIGLIELAGDERLLAGLEDTALAEEVAEEIHVAPVGLGGGLDLVGQAQALALPREAALDGPCEDARPFGTELLGEMAIASR